MLRRHHARAAAIAPHVGGTPARLRRLSVHRTLPLHRRDSRGTDRGDPIVFCDAPVLVLEFPRGSVRTRWLVSRARAGRAAGLRLCERGPVVAGRPEARACGSGMRSSGSEPSSPWSRSATTPSSLSASARSGRRRFARSSRSWSLPQACNDARLKGHDVSSLRRRA